MGLDDIEWYSGPTSDTEVVDLWVLEHGRPTYKQRYPKPFSAWSIGKRLLWLACWPFAFVWAAVVGIVGLLLCVTIVLAPLGMIVVVAAGLPGAALISCALSGKPHKQQGIPRS